MSLLAPFAAPAPDLTADEAMVLTAKIKAHVCQAWVLINEAHDRKAHKALGYATKVDRKAAAAQVQRWLAAQTDPAAAIVLGKATADGLAKRIGDRVKAERVTIPVPSGNVSMPAAYADGAGQLTLWLWLGPDDLDRLIDAISAQADTLASRATALGFVRNLIEVHGAANGHDALVAEGINPSEYAEQAA